MNKQSEIKAAFWKAYAGVPGISRKKIRDYSGNGTMHNTDTRCAFVDFVDELRRAGQISASLAERVTL